MRALLLVQASLLAAALLSGCNRGHEVASYSQPAPTAAVPPAAIGPQSPILQSTRGADPDDLTPLPSGPGLLVAEPEGPKTLRSFGAGCSRWLHVSLGGGGEAGKTCLWSSVPYLAREAGKDHLRLGVNDVKLAGSCLGVTHAAIGMMKGTPASMRVSYQVYDSTTGKPVGRPIVASGSQARIVNSLPMMAQQLAGVIGISGHGLAATVTDSPETLSKLGGYPWDPPDGFMQAEELDLLSRKSPLGLVMYISNRENVNDGGMLIDAIEDTRKVAPRNLMLLGQLGKFGLTGYPALESLKSNVEDLQKLYPNNFLANVRHAAIETGRGDFAKGRPRLERAVRCSPRNASAWLLLCENYSSQANAIRNGVYASAMTEGQVQITSSLYEMQVRYALEAVDRDPKHAAGWLALSGAAAFFGDAELADRAMTALLNVEESNPLTDRASVYIWGLQLYHPKWQEDPEKAKALVKRAVPQSRIAGKSWSVSQRTEVALRAALLGHGEAAAKIASDPESRRYLSEHLEAHRDEMVDPNVRVPGIDLD